MKRWQQREGERDATKVLGQIRPGTLRLIVNISTPKQQECLVIYCFYLIYVKVNWTFLRLLVKTKQEIWRCLLSFQGQQQIYTIVDKAHSPLMWKRHTQHVKLLSQGQTHNLQGKEYCLLTHKAEEAQLPQCAAVRGGCSAFLCHTDLGLLSNVDGVQYLLSTLIIR